MDENAFVAELERICGTEYVVTHPHAKRTYESGEANQPGEA